MSQCVEYRHACHCQLVGLGRRHMQTEGSPRLFREILGCCCSEAEWGLATPVFGFAVRTLPLWNTRYRLCVLCMAVVNQLDHSDDVRFGLSEFPTLHHPDNPKRVPCERRKTLVTKPSRHLAGLRNCCVIEHPSDIRSGCLQPLERLTHVLSEIALLAWTLDGSEPFTERY